MEPVNNNPQQSVPIVTPPINQTPPPPSPQKKKGELGMIIALVIILFLLSVSAVAGFVIYKNLNKQPEQVACTMEAMICPDGSSVGRSGPKCEFSPCPTTAPDPTADWKTYEGGGISFMYPKTYTLSDTNVQNILVSLISPLNSTPRKSYELLEEGELKIEILTPQTTAKSLAEIVLSEKQKPNERSSEPLSFEEKDLMVGDIETIMLKTQYSAVYYVIVDGKLIRIIQYPPKTTRQNEFDQILSSFKFTD